MSKQTTPTIETIGLTEAQPSVLYVVITGCQSDAALVHELTQAPTVGIGSVKPPRATVDELMQSVKIEHNQTVAVIARPGKHAYAEIAAELIRRLNPDLTYVPRDQDWSGCETLTQLGEDGVRHLITRSRLTPISSVIDEQDLIDRALEQLRNPQRDRGARTGWALLDPHYSPAPGYVTIITGVPSHGKSTWLDALLVQIAQLDEQQRFAIFSPESYPVSRHTLRLASRVSGHPWIGPDRMSEETAQHALAWVSQHFWFLDPDVGLSIDAVLEAAEKLLRRHGITGLVIDPWNELEHARPKEMSETEYVSVVLGRIRRWARAHRVHIWVVAHPAKPARQAKRRDEDDEPYIPTPYDISGSANWFNKADLAVTIWRDPRYPNSPTQVHIQKVRVQPEQGCPGTVAMAHDQRTGTYREVTVLPDGMLGHPRPSLIPPTFLADWVSRRSAPPLAEAA